MIRIECTFYKARLQVGADKAGKRGKCPKCGQVLLVPSLSQIDSPLKAATVSAGARSSPDVNRPMAAPSSLPSENNARAIGDTRGSEHVPLTRQRWRTAIVFIAAGLPVAVLIVGVVWFSSKNSASFSSSRESPSQRVSESSRESASQRVSESWRFSVDIPKGFEFAGEQEWEKRRVWILRGKDFGNATETLLVVESTPQDYRSDVVKSLFLAAEIAAGVPRGTMLNRYADVKSFKCTIRIPSAYEEQMLFSPNFNRPEYISPPSSVGAQKFPGLPDLSWPRVPLAELGRNESDIPGGMAVCSGRVRDTLWVVAWAGDYKGVDERLEIIASLCEKLRPK